MNNDELKFILKLLGCANYRSSLSSPSFKSFKDKNKICQSLSDRGWVDFSQEITNVSILPPGKALLTMERDQIPMSDLELTVLGAIAKTSGKVKPSSIKKPKATERDIILQSFAEKGFIQIEMAIKRQKAEVWITEQGLEFLRNDYIPTKGTNPVISLELLNNYVRFLRKSFSNPQQDQSNLSVKSQILESEKLEIDNSGLDYKISDEEILQMIIDLDRELGTDNYLPIFYLRQKLQPPLSRDQVDQALYRLQRQDKIELSILVEAIHYTSEQIEAAIPQEGGSLTFHIIVN